MVVRLKDIRSGQTSENKKGGIVRLADIRRKEEAKIVESQKIEVESLSDSYKQYKQGANNFGVPMLDPSKSLVMQQIEQYNVDHPYGKQELQSPAHNNVPKSAAKVEPKKWNGILDNPIVNTAKSIDKNTHAFVDGFGNGITFGLGNKLAKLTGQQESVDNQHSAAGKVGEITGDLIGMGKAYKLASGLTKGLKAGKVLKTLATGFAAGTGYQTAKETVDMALPEQPTLTDLMNPNGMPQKETLAHRGLDIATTGAMFAGGDLALRYAGKGIKAISDKTGLTSKISKSFDSMFRRTKPSPTEPVQSGPILGLPEPKSAIMAREAQNRSVLPANTDVIHGQGNVETLGLPAGNYTKPTRLKVSGANDTLDYVMRKIKPEVQSKLNMIHENTAEARAQLDDVTSQIDNMKNAYQTEIDSQIKWLKKQRGLKGVHEKGGLIRDETGNVIGRQGTISGKSNDYQMLSNGKYVNNKEIEDEAIKRVNDGYDTGYGGNAPAWAKDNNYHESLASLEQVKTQLSDSLDEINQKGIYELASQAAANHGHDLEALFEKQGGTFADIAKKFKREAAYGYPAEKVNIAKPNFNVTHNADAAMPITKVGRAATIREEVSAKVKPKVATATVTQKTTVKRLDQIRAEAAAKDSIIPENTNGKPLNIESANPQPIKLSNEEIKRAEEAKVFNNSGVGDANTFESKITRGKKAKKTSFNEKWEKLKTQFTEDIAPINKLERNVKGEISSAEDSIYKAARLFKGVPEKINQFIDQRLKPIVRTIEKAGHHSDDLGRYALAVHAKDVNAAGLKSGFTNAEIDDVIKKMGTVEMENARKQLVQINKDLLDELVDSGVVSKEMRDNLNERWKNYIPLTRDLNDVVGRSSGLSEALANVASPIKRLKGSEKNVVEPLENMVENIVKNINAAERNKVASHITKLSKIDPEEKFIRKLKDGEKIEGKSVVSVKENGETVHYEVDKDVRDAILTLDKESSTWLMRFLSVPASWLRAGATLTPEFIIRNPIRDYRNAKIVSESGFRLDDYAVGLASSLMGKFGKGKLYQDWVKNLGAYGNIVSEDRKVFLSSQKKVLTQSASKKFVNVINPKSIITLLRSISDITESSTKVGEYRAALRSGTTKAEAAYRSRDIMDFARAGTSIRQTNKIVAFLNANIQGKSRMIRAFKNDPIGTSIRIFKSMAVPTVGIYYYNKNFANDEQKETIKNAPDWQRNTFWLIAIPSTDMVARIPKPFDFAVVANVVERSLDFFDSDDKEAFDDFGKGVISDNALPMMITALTPLYEALSNRSFFRQSPIIPQRDQNIEYQDQYDPTRTSETAKAVAKGVQKVFGKSGGNFQSPYIIDNTIQGLFAGGGKYATDAVDAILGKTGAVSRPKAPEKSIEQKPVLRSFLIDPNQSGKATDQLYNLKTELTKKEGSAKLHSEEFKEKPKLDYITDQTDIMGKIGTEIRFIEKDMKLSPKQKRDKIDVLVKKRNDIATKAMDYIKSKND